jgi:hypothetical protein
MRIITPKCSITRQSGWEVPSAEYVENYLAKETQLNLRQEAPNTMMQRKNENHQNQNTT